MDVLRNQVIERKVIDLILEHAEFEEVPYQPEETRRRGPRPGGRRRRALRHSRGQARRRRAAPRRQAAARPRARE